MTYFAHVIPKQGLCSWF